MPVTNNPIAVEERLRSKAPRDDWSFEQLQEGYNFQTTSDWIALFVRLVAKECIQIGPETKALDIGCGVGIGRQPGFTQHVKDQVSELWGIEPDTNAPPPSDMFTNHQFALMEQAELPEGYFDLAYSFMVLEHVVDPEAFFNAVARCLKPGGVFFFVTVNAGHYFTRTGKILRALRLDEIVLRVLRGSQVGAYHYPVQYKVNSAAQLRQVASNTGFELPEIIYVEEQGPRPYFPGPLAIIWWVLYQKRRFIRRPESLLTLYGRMKRRTADSAE